MMRTENMKNILLLLVMLQMFAATGGFAQNQRENDVQPKLVVVIVVDQMRADYLSRFDHLFTGGFRRLLDNGFLFTNAYHAHAYTETGAGHAALATGAYPNQNGVVSNGWFDKATKRNVYCVEDSLSAITGKPQKPGRSPAFLKMMTLGDWVRNESWDSKVVSLALKDRTAILMGGFRANLAAWYDWEDGTLVTSLFYTAVYPDWLREFNERRPTEEYFGGVWEKLLPDSAYADCHRDDFPAEADGIKTAFPHNYLPAPDEDPAKYYDNLRSTPFGDHMVIEAAKECVVGEGLGADNDLDLLWIGCSAADYVGHSYGPFSHEVEDYYLRLDRYLGSLIDFLDSLRGSDSYLIALSSDHGVLPLPEHLAEQGIDTRRMSIDSAWEEVEQAGVRVGERMGLGESPILKVNRGVYLNDPVIRNARADWRRVEIEVANELRLLPFIEDVFTSHDLLDPVPLRPYQQLYRNSYYPGRSPDIMFRLKENWLLTNWKFGTSHGECYRYDTDVPMLFYGAGVPHGRSNARVETVSFAPTVGELIGYPPQSDINGRSLVPYLRGESGR